MREESLEERVQVPGASGCPVCEERAAAARDTGGHVHVDRSVFSIGIGQLAINVNCTRTRAWDRVLEHYPQESWPALSQARFQALSEKDIWIATRSRCLEVDAQGRFQRRHVWTHWVALFGVLSWFVYVMAELVVPGWLVVAPDQYLLMVGCTALTVATFLLIAARLWLPQYVAAEVVRLTNANERSRRECR